MFEKWMQWHGFLHVCPLRAIRDRPSELGWKSGETLPVAFFWGINFSILAKFDMILNFFSKLNLCSTLWPRFTERWRSAGGYPALGFANSVTASGICNHSSSPSKRANRWWINITLFSGTDPVERHNLSFLCAVNTTLFSFPQQTSTQRRNLQ